MSDFQRVQRQLTDYIRDPDRHAGPGGVEARRLKIYRDLFYNNIEGFLSGGFPVLRKLYSDESWQALVRDFMVRHHCQSPYFLQIAEEFLDYLQRERGSRADDPPFLLELAHYEWVELALDVAEGELLQPGVDPDGDLIDAVPVVSPLAWSLAYRFPVHRIGPGHVPEEAPAEATYLVVYRNSNDDVKFLETNAVTARLLALLEGGEGCTGRQAMAQIAEEMQHPQPDSLIEHGRAMLERLRGLGIVIGSRAGGG